MKIVACVSHVPDTATKVSIGSDGKTIDPSGVTWVVNPYDEFAIEEALKQKEKLGAEEVVVVSLGPDANKETIRKALAMGADRGVLLKDDSYRDSLNVAKALAEEIKEIGAELVFFGKQAVDYDNGVTGQMTAELLGYNYVSVVVGLEVGDKVTAEREIEGGKEIVETTLPVVITAQKGLNEPRYANLKGIMQAKKKPLDEKEPAAAENYVEVVKMKKPQSKQAGRILGEDASAVPELVKLLNEEAKVI